MTRACMRIWRHISLRQRFTCSIRQKCSGNERNVLHNVSVQSNKSRQQLNVSRMQIFRPLPYNRGFRLESFNVLGPLPTLKTKYQLGVGLSFLHAYFHFVLLYGLSIVFLLSTLHNVEAGSFAVFLCLGFSPWMMALQIAVLLRNLQTRWLQVQLCHQ